MPAEAAVAADDLLGALIAAVLIAFGTAAFALAHLRRVERDVALVSFGTFCALYGIRLLADTDAAAVFGLSTTVRNYVTASITYAIIIPGAIFVEQVLGTRGWRSSIRRLWQAQSVFALVAIISDLARGRPGGALWLNPFFVLLAMAVLIAHLGGARAMLRRPEFRLALAGAAIFIVLAIYATLLPDASPTGEFDPEPLGMLALVVGVGHFAAQRAFSNERRLAALSNEIEMAREIQASIVPASMPAVDGVTVAARYLPATSVAGDFYDFLRTPRGLGILVADVTGHGIAAALVASMLKAALSAQEEHGDDPARVLEGLNRLLAGKFDRSFVTATYVVLDVTSHRIIYATAGHPPVLVRRRGTIVQLDHGELLLGFIVNATYTNAEARLERGDRLVLYTDGILEAVNDGDEYFGDAAFRRSIERCDGMEADTCATQLVEDLAAWTGGRPAADDVTLVIADVT